MATFTQSNANQSTAEIRTWVIDFTDDLLTGVTIASGTAIHTPPSGTAVVTTTIASSTKLNVTLGPLTVPGIHYLEAQATLSDGEISVVKISIPVGYSTPTAREGMADLVEQVRGMADAGPADFTIGAVTYWSDSQIQTVLDAHRITVYQEELTPYPELNTSNEYEYYDYRAPIGNFESGSLLFVVQQPNGGTAPAYTADYLNGIVTFTADTEGSAYMLTGRAYDVNAATADMWRRKAANASKYFDFSTDNHRVSKSQLYKQFMDMAALFDAQSVTRSFAVTTMTRSDVSTYEGEND